MDFRTWEEIFRSLREGVANCEIRGYRFGDFTVMDPEGLKVDTSKSIVKFSDFEKVLDNEEFANQIKIAVQKIFIEKSYSENLTKILRSAEDFCAKEVVKQVTLTKESLFELIKETTGLGTLREIEIYLDNILERKTGGLFIVEPKR